MSTPEDLVTCIAGASNLADIQGDGSTSSLVGPVAGVVTHDPGDGSTPTNHNVGLTDNLDGTYSPGGTGGVDTNANTNPYGPSNDLNWSTVPNNVASGLNTIAAARRPWMNAGSTDVTPTSTDSVLVGDNIHHTGDLSIGFDDTHVPLPAHIHTDKVFLVERAGAAVWRSIHTSIPVGTQEWRYARFAANGKDGWELRPYDETTGAPRRVGLSSDNLSNVGIAQNMPLSDTMGGQNMLVFNGATSAAPAAPPVGATYPSLYAIAGELFVIDGAGNVTQLSSHNETVSDMLEMSGLSHSVFSYNVFSGLGEASDPKTGKFLEFDIDDGSFAVYQAGEVIETGTDERLVFGEKHPIIEEKERGVKYAEMYNKKSEEAGEVAVLDIDRVSRQVEQKKAIKKAKPKKKS